jgi:hypothetical protein
MSLLNERLLDFREVCSIELVTLVELILLLNRILNASYVETKHRKPIMCLDIIQLVSYMNG